MKNSFFIIIIGLIILVGGFYFLKDSKPRVGHGEEVTLEKAKELALWKANRSNNPPWEAMHISVASFENTFFTDYYFLYVWGEMGHTDNRPVAVNQEGDIFILPADFEKLIKGIDIDLKEKKRVKDLIELYLKLEQPMPGLPYLIIDNLSDIPVIHDDIGGDDDEEKQETLKELAVTIKPFNLSLEEGDSLVADFYTWHRSGGVLEKWNIRITSEKEFIVNRKVLGEKIGDYAYIE